MDDTVTRLVPLLGKSMDVGFNVFDVMHHGLHEKQISNVFGWLLDSGGSHQLRDRFATIFIEEVNRVAVGGGQLPCGRYFVHQEVDTSPEGHPGDIADLVLESPTAVIVVENYFTSDGHGHSYDGYRRFGERHGKQSVVVLLCRDEAPTLLTAGWEEAAVVTYGRLIDRLHAVLSADDGYRRANPEVHSFVDQMHRKFGKGAGRVREQDILMFVVAMCETGEARRYGERRAEVAAEQFASDLAVQARERFSESRELLRAAKATLKGFAAGVLTRQLNATLGEGFVRSVTASYAGIYQWSVNFDVPDRVATLDEGPLQIKFGPTAWFANERDPNWKDTVDPHVADYSRLYLARASRSRLRQSVVSLAEVMAGIDPSDLRLHDEIVSLLRAE